MSIYNRRYYIHKVLKPVIKIRAKGKTICLTEDQRSGLTEPQMEKLFELQKIYNYSIQLEIPTDDQTPPP